MNGTPITLKKERPYLDKLTVMTVADAGTASAAIKAGKIQATTAVTAVGVEDALKIEAAMKDRVKVYFPANERGQSLLCQRRKRALDRPPDHQSTAMGHGPVGATTGIWRRPLFDRRTLPGRLLVWQLSGGPAKAAGVTAGPRIRTSRTPKSSCRKRAMTRRRSWANGC